MQNQLLLTDAISAAQELLGSYVIREFNGQQLIGRIVETEAYHQDDPASHSYRGLTARTAPMFGPSHHAYIYLSYGVHFCLNIVAGPKGRGEGVLIRSMEPIAGIELMQKHRHTEALTNLMSGPGKIGQALRLDSSLSGHDLSQSPLTLKAGEPVPADQIITSTRIGISKAAEAPMRFYITDNPHVSRL